MVSIVVVVAVLAVAVPVVIWSYRDVHRWNDEKAEHAAANPDYEDPDWW